MPDKVQDCILSLEIEHKDEVAYVKCHGRLIAEVGGNFYTRIRQLMPDHKRIILDLSDLTYMDSMGLGTLVRLVVSAKTNGCSLELINLGKRIRELLGLTHLLHCFTIIGEQGTTLGF
jgi:anti-sigma B factor antagonist